MSRYHKDLSKDYRRKFSRKLNDRYKNHSYEDVLIENA